MPRLFRRFTALPVVLTVILLAPVSAPAGTVAARDLASLARDADEIVIGTCERNACRWVGNKVFTDTEVRPERCLKGNTEGTVTLTHVGGTVREPIPVAMLVPEMPRFDAGESVLVFVYRGPRSRQVLGLTQGKLTIAPDAGGVERVSLSADLPAGSGMETVAGRPLADVVAEIERVLAQEPEAEKEVQR